MCHDPKLFPAITPFHATITTANGKPMHSKGKGTVVYKYGSSSITLNNTLFCPELQQNLISIPVLTQQGFSVTFHPSHCDIKGPGTSVHVPRSGNLYAFSAALTNTTALVHTLAKTLTSLEEWHLRFNHLHDQTIIKMR